MNHVSAVLVLILCTPCFLYGATAATTPATQPASPLQRCTDLALQAVDHAESLLPQMAAAADAAAKRWIAGADIFVGGDDSFTDEAFYRAGGLIGLRRIAAFKQNFNGRQVRWDDVPEESVVLYGLHAHTDPAIILFDELGHLAFERDTVVFFGSKRWPVSQKIIKMLEKRLPEKFFFIDTDLPVDTRLKTADGTAYGSYAPMVTAVHLWTFTAELVAACTRQGQMPGIWPSGSIPKYEVWEKKYEAIKFHDDFTIKPIEAGALGRQYLDIVRAQVRAIPKSAEQVKTAAKLLRSVPADKAVYVMVESHLLAGETQLPVELPNWLLVQRGWRWKRAAGTIESGDGILWLGYIDWPNGEVRKARQQQNLVAAVSVKGPGENPDADKDTIWVPAPWVYPDAVVEIVDYPLKACPTSGIVQGTLLLAIIGEAIQTKALTTASNK